MMISFLAALTSCSVGPDYVCPCIEVPSGWKNGVSCDGAPEAEGWVYLDDWWQVFDDEVLDRLENWALENNRELYSAYQRIEEARALMGVAKADLYPQLTLNPLFTNTGELIQNYNALPPILGSIPRFFRAHELLYFFPLNLSYEVDLWGKIRDQYASAKYNWLASREDYDAVMLSLTSALATAYYQLRVTDLQSDLLLETLKNRKKALEINTDRYEGEITFYSDVTLAAEEVDLVTAQYDEVRRQRDLLEDQIAVLIGVPASEFCLEHLPLQGLPPCVPEGIPSEALLRRPDIARAEFYTRSQHALVKEAYAQFFPSLTLTGVLGFESPIFKDFMKWISRYWAFGEQINQLLFDGFRTSSNLELQVAKFQETSGDYQQQVLVAFQEVEDALANLASYAKQYDSVLGATNWSEKSYQLYLDRYHAGVTYYIDVVNTERDFLNNEISLSSVEGYRYLSTIQLIKALGGGWSFPEDACALTE